MDRLYEDELRACLEEVLGVLERLEIPYMIVGGYAATLYGEPRLTLDVDIVVDMHVGHVPAFVASFSSDEFYVSEDGIRDSLARRYPFNVIESATAAKADLVPLSVDPFTRGAFDRRQRVVYDSQGHSAAFIAAEDLVVAKLLAFQATGSDRHLRDARGVLVTQGERLDLGWVRRVAGASGVGEVLDRLLKAGQKPTCSDGVDHVQSSVSHG